jgi:hypothetical protein
MFGYNFSSGEAITEDKRMPIDARRRKERKFFWSQLQESQKINGSDSLYMAFLR